MLTAFLAADVDLGGGQAFVPHRNLRHVLWLPKAMVWEPNVCRSQWIDASRILSAALIPPETFEAHRLDRAASTS